MPIENAIVVGCAIIASAMILSATILGFCVVDAAVRARALLTIEQNIKRRSGT